MLGMCLRLLPNMHGLIHLAPVQKETAHTIIYRSLEDRELLLLSQ
jgi:hypothetical protein